MTFLFFSVIYLNPIRLVKYADKLNYLQNLRALATRTYCIPGTKNLIKI